MKAKLLLTLELVFLFGFATAITTLVFLHGYTYHFQKVTLNYYMNGSTDFTTDATNLVQSFGALSILTLTFGTVTGAAVGLTYNVHLKKKASEAYEQKIAGMGFVHVEKTSGGNVYRLTELGRRFLNEYRNIEQTEKATVQTRA